MQQPVVDPRPPHDVLHYARQPLRPQTPWGCVLAVSSAFLVLIHIVTQHNQGLATVWPALADRVASQVFSFVKLGIAWSVAHLVLCLVLLIVAKGRQRLWAFLGAALAFGYLVSVYLELRKGLP